MLIIRIIHLSKYVCKLYVKKKSLKCKFKLNLAVLHVPPGVSVNVNTSKGTCFVFVNEMCIHDIKINLKIVQKKY